MTTRLRLGFLAALPLVAMLGAPASASAAQRCKHAEIIPSVHNLDQVSGATRCLVNVERRRRGRKPLRASRSLRRAAERFSIQMVSDGNFSHVGRSGSTLQSRVREGSYLRGARTWALAENIAWASGRIATPRSIVRNWMRSRSHRANILNRRYRHLGVGVAIGSPVGTRDRSAATYTADFGRRGKRRL